jgi:hypothetical protein
VAVDLLEASLRDEPVRADVHGENLPLLVWLAEVPRFEAPDLEVAVLVERSLVRDLDERLVVRLPPSVDAQPTVRSMIARTIVSAVIDPTTNSQRARKISNERMAAPSADSGWLDLQRACDVINGFATARTPDSSGRAR